MHHRHVGDGDVERLGDPAVTADDDVLDVVDQVGPVVAHGVEFAGGGVVLRVGTEGAGERVVEAVDAQRVQLVVELDGRLAGFDHRPGGAGEPADVGVGPERIGAGDVPIAIPLGPTTA